MINFVHLGVSVSLDYTFNNLPIICKLVKYRELNYVLENRTGEVLSIDDFKEFAEKLVLEKQDMFETMSRVQSLDDIKSIHFIYKIFSIMAEHSGSIFSYSSLTVDKNISKLKHGKRIFKAVGIEKDKISVGYTFSSYE